MKTVGDVITAVKRFVYNNSNAVDSYQGNSETSFEEFLTGACMTAVNNARKYAEMNASWSWLDTTVATFFPVGMGINLERQYPDDGNFNTVTDDLEFSYRYDRLGFLYIKVQDTAMAALGYDEDELYQIRNDSEADLPLGVYTVWSRLDDIVTIVPEEGEVPASETREYVYKMAYRDQTITSPTSWVTVGTPAGQVAFNSYVRLNAVYSISAVNTTGGLVPLDLDTRQSQHIKATQQNHHGFYTSENEHSFPPDQFRVLFDGRQLVPNAVLSQDLDVVITAARWLKDYTSVNDTDPFIEDGFEFMMWRSVLELNYVVQVFVARADGIMSPPEKAFAAAWDALLTNDAFSNTSYYHQ